MEMYAWGANSHGQLGVGTFSEFEVPQKVDEIPQNISFISGGAGHTMILDASGDLFATGWNNKGQLGIGSTNDSSRFVKIDCNQKFQKVSCGWDTSAGITVDDRLFVWGSNSQNQLGFSSRDHKMFKQPVEFKLPMNEKAADIQFGLRHTVILSASNKIFIVGSMRHFKGVKHQTINHNSTEYLLISHTNRVRQISSGQNHMAFLDDQNEIHALGDNKFMQCSTVKPTDKVVKFASGWTHNAFLTDSKELFLYGRNNYGQLGNGSRSESESTQKLTIHPVDDFQLGAEHGILLSNGDIFTWGWNEHGNCGNGSVDDLLLPEKIKLPSESKVASVTAGSGFCMVVLNSTD